MFTYGYDENNNKVYFDTRAKNIGAIRPVVDDSDLEVASKSLTFNTLQEELSYIGFNETEITNIMNKIENVDSGKSDVDPVTTTDPQTGQQTTNSKGSLVSNSALAIKNNSAYQKANIEVEKAKVKAILAQNEIQKKILEVSDYALIMQSQVYGQLYELNANIKDLTKETKNQELTANIGNVVHDITIDTTALTTATATLATGVENQIATNAKIVEKIDKQIEHYDFLAKGVDTLKDSKGNIIKPREVEAKNNAEQHMDKESFNKFDSSVLIDSLDEIDKDFDSDVETIKNLFSSILVLDKDKFKTELNQNIFKVAP